MPEVVYKAEEDAGLIGYEDNYRVWIQFQHGPVQENGINGVQNEELLELLVMRLNALQMRMPCPENLTAIENISDARDALLQRTAKRVAQGIEGTDRPHSDTEVKSNE